MGSIIKASDLFGKPISLEDSKQGGERVVLSIDRYIISVRAIPKGVWVKARRRDSNTEQVVRPLYENLVDSEISWEARLLNRLLGKPVLSFEQRISVAIDEAENVIRETLSKRATRDEMRRRNEAVIENILGTKEKKE